MVIGFLIRRFLTIALCAGSFYGGMKVNGMVCGAGAGLMPASLPGAAHAADLPAP